MGASVRKRSRLERKYGESKGRSVRMMYVYFASTVIREDLYCRLRPGLVPAASDAAAFPYCISPLQREQEIIAVRFVDIISSLHHALPFCQ
jgi:hypothetical protein